MRYCLICFNKIEYKGIYSYITKPTICHTCFKELNRNPLNIKLGEIKVLSLYPYKDKIKSLLYQFKGCYDVELSKVFLSYDYLWLKIIFKNYIIVPVPSYYLKDKQRGFNHVEKIFSFLNLPIKKILYKKTDYKQSELKKKERQNSVNNIGLIFDKDLEGKNLLLVDDIITTGYTILRCVSLLKTLNPKKIKVITISYSLSNFVKI